MPSGTRDCGAHLYLVSRALDNCQVQPVGQLLEIILTHLPLSGLSKVNQGLLYTNNANPLTSSWPFQEVLVVPCSTDQADLELGVPSPLCPENSDLHCHTWLGN